MKTTVLLLSALVLLVAVLAGPALADPQGLSFGASFKSDPTVDDRSDFDAWIFQRHFKANEPYETSFEEYVLSAGDTLWSVAAKPEIYSDPEMYPFLAAANPQYFKLAAGAREGMSIRIPREYDADLASLAHSAAWCPTFADAMGIRFDRPQYLAWLDSKVKPARVLAMAIQP